MALSIPASDIGDGNECVTAEITGTMNGMLNGNFVKAGIAPCQSQMIGIETVESKGFTNTMRVKSSWVVGENASLDYQFIVSGMKLKE